MVTPLNALASITKVSNNSWTQQDMTKIFFVLRNLEPIKLTHKLSKRQQTIYSNIIVLKVI